MSDYVRPEGTGNVFKVEKKSDKSPDWRIEFKVNGKVYKVAIWKNADKPNVPYAFKIEEEQPAAPVDAAPDQADMDDLPF